MRRLLLVLWIAAATFILSTPQPASGRRHHRPMVVAFWAPGMGRPPLPTCLDSNFCFVWDHDSCNMSTLPPKCVWVPGHWGWTFPRPVVLPVL